MKVLNLRCSNGHGFEGWFASEDDFLQQNGSGLLDCPLCNDKVITRLPSAPRLNLSGARAPSEKPAPAQGSGDKPSLPVATAGGAPAQAVQAAWIQAVRQVLANTEDVGQRFPEEARRMHYGEIETRGIRGQATPEERAALLDEGIEVMPLPLPAALKEPLQ